MSMFLHNANDNADDAKSIAITQVLSENSQAKNSSVCENVNFDIHTVKLYLDFMQKLTFNHNSLKTFYFYHPLKKK